MQITKRNHYNPCFWTAYWNSSYYSKALKGDISLDARKQVVFTLSVKANKILKIKVEDVHYEKSLGIAEMTPDAIKDFCKRNFPEKYESICKYVQDHPETLYLDFENFFSGVENTQIYRVLPTIISKQRVDTEEERTNLACFVYMHDFRCHATMTSLIQLSEEAGIKKFEYFWQLQNAWSDTDFLFSQVIPLIKSSWQIFRTEIDVFPLCDSPILGSDKDVLVALSPRLLLRIDITKKQENLPVVEPMPAPKELISEFRVRTISNTFREIIFSQRKTLQMWQETIAFKERYRLVRSIKSYNSLLIKEGMREIWHINAFRNRLK